MGIIIAQVRENLPVVDAEFSKLQLQKQGKLSQKALRVENLNASNSHGSFEVTKQLVRHRTRKSWVQLYIAAVPQQGTDCVIAVELFVPLEETDLPPAEFPMTEEQVLDLMTRIQIVVPNTSP